MKTLMCEQKSVFPHYVTLTQHRAKSNSFLKAGSSQNYDYYFLKRLLVYDSGYLNATPQIPQRAVRLKPEGKLSRYGRPAQLHSSTRTLLLSHLGGCKPWPWSCRQLQGPERRLCFLSAHHSSSEQQSTTTSNFQEQFSNSGERKLTPKKKKSEPYLWSNLLRFVPLIANSVNIQKKMTIRTAEIRFF